MKIYYNSRLAKILTFLPNFSTMMFFGCVITESKWLSKKTIVHEGCHALQYRDVTKVGVPLSVILFFVTVSYIDIAWWMLLYTLIGPFSITSFTSLNGSSFYSLWDLTVLTVT